MKTKGKAKRLLTMLLAFVMLVGLIPTTAFAVGTETVGDFTVTGGTKGEDYTYADGVLRIIKSGADLTLSLIHIFQCDHSSVLRCCQFTRQTLTAVICHHYRRQVAHRHTHSNDDGYRLFIHFTYEHMSPDSSLFFFIIQQLKPLIK